MPPDAVPPTNSTPKPPVLDRLTAFLGAEVAAMPKSANSTLSSAYTGQATDAPPFFVSRRDAPRPLVVLSRHPNSLDAAISEKVGVGGKPQGLQVRFYAQLPTEARQVIQRLMERFSLEHQVGLCRGADYLRMSSI